MYIQVQRAAKSLDQRHRAGLRGLSSESCFLDQLGRDGPVHDPQPSIPGDSRTGILIEKGSLAPIGVSVVQAKPQLEHRRGKFILSDQSTNGTFVRTIGGQIIFLRRKEFTCTGRLYQPGQKC